MTSLARHREFDRAAPSGERIVALEWAVGRIAGRPDRALRWTVTLDGDRAIGAVATLTRADLEEEVARIDGRDITITPDPGRGLLHIDAPPLLAATLRREGDALRPVFARTSLFARLEIPGGRYELRS